MQREEGKEGRAGGGEYKPKGWGREGGVGEWVGEPLGQTEETVTYEFLGDVKRCSKRFVSAARMETKVNTLLYV